ncbi:MAG: hypothetical protein JNM17_00180 [Archangium sp.]|nr:hypothetical protein [Archangium sp.]
MTRRERMVGFSYTPLGGGALRAEVRKACRDELKILYTGTTFDDSVWERLRSIGELNVFEASKLNAAMKDIVRVKGEGLRVEGVRDGELVVAFFAPGARGVWRKKLERLLTGTATSSSASSVPTRRAEHPAGR